MAEFETITSLQNQKVKLIPQLREKRNRQKHERFVIDSVRDFVRAVEAGIRIDYVFVCDQISGYDLELIESEVIEIIHVTAAIMKKLSYRQNPDWLIAVCYTPDAIRLEELTTEDFPKRILALVGLNKPGNIGALLRTADAANFEMIWLIDCELDLYNPNIIRASTGTVFLDNVVELRSEQAQGLIRQLPHQVLSGHLSGEEDLYAVKLSQKSIVILGKEETGLEDDWLPYCQHIVKIPMAGKISDSLNVSVSGALFMYEVYRQHHYKD